MQKSTFFFAGIVLCLLILTTAFYWYQKPREGLTDIKPAYTISAKDLYSAFQENEEKANQKFLKKVIEVKGIVDHVQVTDSTVNLLLSSGREAGGINCNVIKGKNKEREIPLKGAVITVKGRCVGFLMDVNLVDAVIDFKNLL